MGNHCALDDLMFLCIITYRVSAVSFASFKRISSLDNYTFSGNTRLFDDTDSCRSLSDCHLLCLNTPACHGIFYGPVHQTCRGCTAAVRDGLVNSDLIMESELTQFYLRGTSSTHGQHCNIMDECDTNQYCGEDGACTCNLGFSYSPTMDRCNTGCLQYGDTFENHPGKKILSNMYNRTFDVAADNCKAMCVADRTCVSCDYKVTTLRCGLQNVTSRTSYHPVEESSKHVFSQRNCI